MSETSGALPSKEEIESQQQLLLDIQTQHAKEMAEAGITDKARAVLEKGGSPLNDLSRPYVTITAQETDEGPIEQIGIRFATANLLAHGSQTSRSPEVPVATYSGYTVELDHESGFTLDEAHMLKMMADGIKQARDLGVLPNLSLSGRTVSINNPYTAIQYAPRPEQ